MNGVTAAASTPSRQLLRGLRVGISGAVPEPEWWGENRDLDQAILRFVAQLVALVFKYGGAIVHGSHPSFTPIIVAQAERFGVTAGDGRLTLIASTLFGPTPQVVAGARSVANVVLTPKIDVPDQTKETRALSLTALRLTLAATAQVLVAIGGKLHRETGHYPGVLEELTLARWNRRPCVLAAAYGGFASRFQDEMVASFSTGNQMDADTYRELASWTGDVDFYAGVIARHMVENAQALSSQREADLLALLPSWLSRVTLAAGRPSLFGTENAQAALVAAAQRAQVPLAEVRKAFEAGDSSRLGKLLAVPPPDVPRSRHWEAGRADA